MSLFLCPICGQQLQREKGRYVCPLRHSYDIASAGYVHLLPANKKHSLIPGDDKQMAAARNRFLRGGGIFRCGMRLLLRPQRGCLNAAYFLTPDAERDTIPRVFNRN